MPVPTDQAFDALEEGVMWLWRGGLEPDEIAQLAGELAHTEAAETERYWSREALAEHAHETREAISLRRSASRGPCR